MLPANTIVIEKDVDVPMRDGARLKADIFRPQGAEKVPAILNLGPYQKDKLWVTPDTLEEKHNPYMNWETVNPLWWVPRGYAAVRVDGRGSGKSPGQHEPWSHCRSGRLLRRHRMGGGATLVQRQSRPHRHFLLRDEPMVRRQSDAAVAEGDHPWEGAADLYRDALYHGGLFSVFMTNWFTAHMMHHLLGRASRVEPDRWKTDTLYRWLHDSLDSGALHGAQAQWDKITVPMFTVGNWSGMALHLRGNTEAFMRAASKHKKLRIHAGSHVHAFYTEEGRRRSDHASSTTGSRASRTA